MSEGYGIRESRIETLEALFKKLKAGIMTVKCEHSAIIFTQPVCDAMLIAVSHLINLEDQDKVDDLLSKVLNVQVSDTTDDDSNSKAD